jgi:hypothetical protein
MSIFLDFVNRRLLVATNILAILTFGPCAVLAPRPLAAQAAEPQPAKLDAATLEGVVARVALYPDPLLAQVLAAATFAEQIPAATQWAAQHKTLKGDALAQAMDTANLGFDPSVQSLLAFPSVLELMNKDLDWTQRLGDATLIQRGEVMDAVQRMRKKAYDAGNLKSSQQITVVQSAPQVIEIQPPSPTVIYVPVYSPQVVYVAAPPPPPGAVVTAAVLGFAIGVALSNSYCTSYWGYHGGFGWSSHTVIIHNSSWGRTWVNHTTYVHAWGGSNRGFYARPNAYVNTHAYVRHNTNVNVNRNTNVNVNRNTNVNANRNQNVNRNTNVNPNVNRAAYQSPSRNAYSGNATSANARGYTPQSSARSGTFSGVQNGRSEHAAAARGNASRGRRR